MTLTPRDLTPPERTRDGSPIVPGLGFPDDLGIRPSQIKIGDEKALTLYQLRGLARGFINDEALLDEFRSTDIHKDDDVDWRVKKALDGICRKAMSAGGGDKGLTIGSQAHKGFEYLAEGGDPDVFTTEPLRSILRAGQAAMEQFKIEVRATELFVASPELGTAGSLDTIVRTPTSDALVMDYKSSKPGAERFAAMEWLLQQTCYAHSKPWCRDRGLLEWEDLGLEPPTRDKALILHTPAKNPNKTAIHLLDLTQGPDLLTLALGVIRARRTPANQILTTYPVTVPGGA